MIENSEQLSGNILLNSFSSSLAYWGHILARHFKSQIESKKQKIPKIQSLIDMRDVAEYNRTQDHYDELIS